MKAKNRVWYSLEKLNFDKEGFTPAMLVGEHGKVVGEWPSSEEKGFLMVLIKYQVWEK